MSTHLYAYGVVGDDGLDREVEGVEGAERVYTVSYGPIAAVVSDVEDMDPERTDENLQAHDEVLREVMLDADLTVVPMQYGMTFKNARTLKSVLRGGQRAFRKSLSDLEDTVELGVKLVATEGATLERDAVREDAAERFRAVSVEESEDDRFTDRLVLNRSYLVDRAARSEFDDAVEGVEEEYGDVLAVNYSGPWAPYNFVDIEVGAQ